MIPVRTDRLPDVLAVYDRPGPSLAGQSCPACDLPYAGAVVLVGIGPGPYGPQQAAARAGRWHTGAAVAVHALCAGRGADGKPVPVDQPEPNAEDTAKVGDPDPTPETEPWCGATTEPYGTLGVQWSCSRRPGHGGQHVAGVGERVGAVWSA